MRGAIEKKNACITCYPCDSGNDFIKCYGGKDRFLNTGKLVRGTEHRIDGMRVNDTYSINVVNFGFDTFVCQTIINVRRKPIIGSKNAYTTGIVTALIKALSRTVFPKLIGVYTAGKHLEDERYKDIITYLRGKKVVVDSAAPGFAMSVDGEIVAAPHFEIEILPDEIRFIVPEGAVEI